MADDLHSAWARLFADTLARCGVAHAVISPGSRSTPLALALAQALPHTVLHDERAAAFFALGQARVNGQPSVVLATSGSAPGHWLPAAMEAREAGVPLLLLSADRPWEVQQAQASQTVDQLRLFGVHVQGCFELGLPDPHPAALRAVPRIAAQAVLATRYPLPGAVQVNAHFRKPLEPQPATGTEPWRADVQALDAAGAPVLFAPALQADAAALESLVARVRAAPEGLLVVGPVPATQRQELAAAVQAFQSASGYVLLAEATSQLRFGPHDAQAGPRCGAFDAVLRSAAVRRALRPQLALEVGAPAVSAAWLAWAEGVDAPPRIVLPGLRPADPAGGALGMWLGPPAALLRAAAERLRALPASAAAGAAARRYAERWRCAETAAWAARPPMEAEDPASAAQSDGLPAARPLCECDIAPLLRAALPDGAWLMVGNSSPVRDLDHDLPPDPRPLTLLHQRGAAGIDGLIAGAAGSRSVCPSLRALLLGDVSLLHDVGALALLAAVAGPLAVVVVNNDGGRIFERLPLGRDAALQQAREQLFVVPHGRCLADLAAGFGLDAVRVQTGAALQAALQQALGAPRPMLIEACPLPQGSAQRARALARLAAAAEEALADAQQPGSSPIAAAES